MLPRPVGTEHRASFRGSKASCPGHGSREARICVGHDRGQVGNDWPGSTSCNAGYRGLGVRNLSVPLGTKKNTAPGSPQTQGPARVQIGDWGRQGLKNQSEVAAVMGELAHTRAPEFIISTGDNFYQCVPTPRGSDRGKVEKSYRALVIPRLVYPDPTPMPWHIAPVAFQWLIHACGPPARSHCADHRAG